MRILVSGAGIAGSVLAYWLHRHGLCPVVVERTTAPRVGLGGHAVDLFAPALEVVARMGLEAPVRQARTELDALALVRPGKSTVEIAFDDLTPEFADDRHVEILRGELVTLLHDAVRDDVEHRFGDAIRSMRESSGGVEVGFDSGTTERFDLVLGADGLHSAVRRLTFGDADGIMRHLGGYLAVFSVPRHLALADRTTVYNGIDRVAAVYPVRQTGQARAVLVFRRSGPGPQDHHDVLTQQRFVRESYAGEGWVIPDLLDAMEHADDFYFDSVSQVRLDTWSRGRVGLVGDAGFAPGPAVGGGTTLAVVSAYVLARALAEAKGDHTVAFAAYQSQIRDYVRACRAAAPRALRNGIPSSRLHRAANTAALRLLPRLPGWAHRRLLSRGVSHALSEFRLPD